MTRSDVDALIARHLFDFTGALVAAGVLKVKPI